MPITIRCPKCSTKLKIDDAFSAGVCRCGKCGQVMKVPKREPTDASQSAAEKPARPETPGSAPPPPEAPPPAEVAASPEPTPPPAPEPPESPEPDEEAYDDDDPLAALAAQAGGMDYEEDEEDDDDATEAASMLDDESAEQASSSDAAASSPQVAKPPSAPKPKRKGNKLMMLFIIFGTCIILGGFVALAIFAMGGDKSGVPKEMREELGFDPSINPFTVAQGNVLGVPLAKRSVIAIDASGTSRQWFTLVQDAVIAGVKQLDAKSEVQVIFWVEGEPLAYPKSGPIAMTDSTVTKLQSFFDDVRTSGQADPAPSVIEAVKKSPDQIVLITSQQIFPDSLKKLSEVLAGYPKVKVDAISIEEELPELKRLIETRGGRFVPMPQSRIEDWYREAANAPPPVTE